MTGSSHQRTARRSSLRRLRRSSRAPWMASTQPSLHTGRQAQARRTLCKGTSSSLASSRGRSRWSSMSSIRDKKTTGQTFRSQLAATSSTSRRSEICWTCRTSRSSLWRTSQNGTRPPSKLEVWMKQKVSSWVPTRTVRSPGRTWMRLQVAVTAFTRSRSNVQSPQVLSTLWTWQVPRTSPHLASLANTKKRQQLSISICLRWRMS